MTFLFTDIEGSTRLWERFPLAMRVALERHDALLHEIIATHQGDVFKTVGDAFCAVFADPLDALRASLAAQFAMLSTDWKDIVSLRVRMALHCGEPDRRGNDFFGRPVNTVARLLGAGHGGQVLLSGPVRDALGDQLAGECMLEDLGTHRLRDVQQPLRIFQAWQDGLPHSFSPLKTLDYDPHNIPAQVTSFVGRHGDLDHVQAMLGEPGVRLLTLTGPGGVGKTRLAMQAALRMREEFADGRYLVSLASLREASEVPVAIAQALEIPDTGEGEVLERLLEHVQDKSLLLVLDNFEHVLPARDVVMQVLQSAPGVKVVVTSRILLQVYGEQEFAVVPFAVPVPGDDLSLEEIAQFDAVTLFLDRARSVRSGFELNPANAKAVAEICARLDGLPLAIELAAARSKLLSPDAMVQRLEQRLMFLQGKNRGVPERQQTIRATIEWSHDLLQPAEQAVFRWLSVFSGGFTMESAMQLIDLFRQGSAAASSGIPAAIEESIETLIDNSLIQVIDPGTGEPRLLILETLREYGHEQLARCEELDVLQRDHAIWCINLAVEARRDNAHANEQRALDLLEAEHDNIRAALAWLSRQPATEDCSLARLAANMWWFWLNRGFRSEWKHWLPLALEQDDGVLAADRADVRSGLGTLLWLQGDLRQAETLLEQSVALSRDSGNVRIYVSGLNNLANIKRTLGNHALAANLYREAIDTWKSTGEKRSLGTMLGNLAQSMMSLGDFEAAQRTIEEALEVQRGLNHLRGVATSLANLARIALDLDDVERAIELNQQSMDLYVEQKDTESINASRLSRAEMELRRGNVEMCQAFLEECREYFEQEDVGAYVSRCRALESRLVMLEGKYEEVGLVLLEAIKDHAERDILDWVMEELEWMGECRMRLGDARTAALLVASVDTLRSSHSLARSPADARILDAVRRELAGELGEEALFLVRQEGAAMDLDACVALILALFGSEVVESPAA